LKMILSQTFRWLCAPHLTTTSSERQLAVVASK
jgi:hypothetical protein